eukprot:392606_1
MPVIRSRIANKHQGQKCIGQSCHKGTDAFLRTGRGRRKEHRVQAHGFTLNFKDDPSYDIQALEKYQKEGLLPLTEDELDKIRDEQQKDSVLLEYHGMKLRFNKDHEASRWHASHLHPYNDYSTDAYNQYTPYDAQLYLLPLVLFGLLILCTMFIICMCVAFASQYHKVYEDNEEEGHTIGTV